MRTLACLCLAACAALAADRTILAVGAHAGDMEITCGALLAKQAAAGDRVVLLHLTLGEGGNPKLSPEAYGAQKRREALAAAKALGAEALFGPYRDGSLPSTEEAAHYVARVIREQKPAYVITHWKNSMHKDHEAAHHVTKDAVLLASLEEPGQPAAWRGVRGLYYAENWEDPEGFSPYLFFDVSSHVDAWRKAVTEYEFIRGGISSFSYLDYYEGLMKMRGALARKKAAIAFDIDPEGKRRVLDALP
jgi:LmbE family N-acetylglucosaminyl deacetylase